MKAPMFSWKARIPKKAAAQRMVAMTPSRLVNALPSRRSSTTFDALTNRAIAAIGMAIASMKRFIMVMAAVAKSEKVANHPLRKNTANWIAWSRKKTAPPM